MIRRAFASNNNTYLPIFVIVALNLIIGLIIVGDFGESVDEDNYILYGEDTISAYRNLRNIRDESRLDNYIFNYYGPFYITVSKMVQNLVGSFDAGIPSEKIIHFMYFVSFQIGVFSLYVISRRFIDQWAAIGATLFFSTQPLLFGHAFINPKDIPFMAFFLATIAAGLWLADSELNTDMEVQPLRWDNLLAALVSGWGTLRLSIVRLLIQIGITISIGIAVFYARDGINMVLSGVIDFALSADPATPLGIFAARLAENSGRIATESYIAKGLIVFWRFYSFLIVGIILFLLLVYLGRFRSNGKEIWAEVNRPFFGQLNLSLPKKIWLNLSQPKLILAGIVLGLCTSIRVIGPAAGGLVAIYLIFHWKKHSIATIIAYFSVAALVTYIFWPFLWEAPIARFAESLRWMADFPKPGVVLFDGVLYTAYELPDRYLPTLLLLQFTEPTMLLFFGGSIAGIYYAITRRKNIPGIILLLLWFWIPTLFIIISKPAMYNNFRHVLFVIPPIFVFSGILFDTIYKKIKHKWVFVLIIAGIITPGVYSSIRLHPYEYVYYNRFAGGLEGAVQKYELDYWATSYKEAMEYVNQVADPNVKIVVWRASYVAEGYARDDLIVDRRDDNISETLYQYDYVIILKRQNPDTDVQITGEEVFRVVRDNAVFVIVKRISN